MPSQPTTPRTARPPGAATAAAIPGTAGSRQLSAAALQSSQQQGQGQHWAHPGGSLPSSRFPAQAQQPRAGSVASSVSSEQQRQQRTGSGGDVIDADLVGLQEAHEKIGTLTAEVEELLEENEKLRVVEEQFWLILTEREELQNEVNTMRSSLQQLEVVAGERTAESGAGRRSGRGAPSPAPYSATAPTAAHQEHEALRIERDQLASALSESLGLLIEREVLAENEYIRKHGPVAAFLSWLQVGHERGLALRSLHEAGATTTAAATTTTAAAGDASRGQEEQSHQRGGGTGSVGRRPESPLAPSERAALTSQLHEARRTIESLQEELDRTDVSRVQALEDAERLQAQLESVVENMRELRAAYAALKAQAERSNDGAHEVVAVRRQLADRETEVAQLKSTIAELRRMQDVGGAQLAADAVRIRRELLSRSAAGGGSSGTSGGGGGGHSPPTPKVVPVGAE